MAIIVLGALGEWLIRRKDAKLGESEELDSSNANLPRAFGVMLLFVGYSVLTPVLGFLSSTLVFLILSGRLLGLPWRTTLLLAIPLSIALWAIFVIGLKVAFGHGWLI